LWKIWEFASRNYRPLAWLWLLLWSKHSGMVRFYWAIVVVATLTIIAVVAFSKDKNEVAAASQTVPTEKVVQAGDLSASLKP